MLNWLHVPCLRGKGEGVLPYFEELFFSLFCIGFRDLSQVYAKTLLGLAFFSFLVVNFFHFAKIIYIYIYSFFF
jgi:hypothetical protein